MLKILIAECKQEISSFNPVETQYEAFVINRGDQLFAYHRGIESEIGGALDVFSARDDVDAVPVWGARAGSAGPLAQDAFERLAAEFTEALAAHKDGGRLVRQAKHAQASTDQVLIGHGEKILFRHTRHRFSPRFAPKL